MKKALVVGGSNGIGLAIAQCLYEKEYHVTVIDKVIPDTQANEKIDFVQFDLTNSDYSVFDQYTDVNLLMITAGFGSLELFENIDEQLISDYFQVNTIAPIRIVKHFYHCLLGSSDFQCGIMVSIAGFMSSPFFSVYGATKAALKIFIESVNVELEKAGSKNRILNISPGSIQGTQFNGNSKNDLSSTRPLAQEILSHLQNKDDLFIPRYDEVFREVLERYHRDFRAEGRHSYEYKILSGRIKK